MVKKDDLSKVIRDIQNVGGRIAGIVYNKKFIENVLKKCIETDTYLVIDEYFNDFLENGI